MTEPTAKNILWWLQYIAVETTIICGLAIWWILKHG